MTQHYFTIEADIETGKWKTPETVKYVGTDRPIADEYASNVFYCGWEKTMPEELRNRVFDAKRGQIIDPEFEPIIAVIWR